MLDPLYWTIYAILALANIAYYIVAGYLTYALYPLVPLILAVGGRMFSSKISSHLRERLLPFSARRHADNFVKDLTELISDKSRAVSTITAQILFWSTASIPIVGLLGWVAGTIAVSLIANTALNHLYAMLGVSALSAIGVIVLVTSISALLSP
jgi:hypothetical protein